MLDKTLSAAGIAASIIEVEVDVSGIKTNEDHFHTVGLPDAAVRESRDRVRAALKNCGYRTRDHVHLVIRVPPTTPLPILLVVHGRWPEHHLFA
jgi:magnesium chelatase family protein